MAVKVQLDKEAVRRVPQELVLPLVRKVGRRVERGARGTVRVKSGAVRNGIESTLRTTRSKVIWTVGAYHRRSMLEHEGAISHPIEMKPGGPILTFYWEKAGEVVHFTAVKHPGTKGSEFLTIPLKKQGAKSGFRVVITRGGR